MSAAAICTTNLTSAGSGMMSSMTPTITTTTLPKSIPCTSLLISANSTTLRIKPRNMAKPPRRGIGCVCILRPSFGTSIAPTRVAKDLTIGVAAKLMINDAAIARPTGMKSSFNIIAPDGAAVKAARVF